MKEVLSANFFRLKKDKVFKLFIGITILIAIFYVGLGHRNLMMQKSEIDMPDEMKIDYFAITINKFIVVLGLFSAMFVSIFVGKDYSNGTIRNKIVVRKK